MGLGTSSCGTTPCGFGDAEEAPDPPAPAQWSREVDPMTGDYSIDATTGAFRRMTPTRQRVLLTLVTALKSSTVQQEWGIRRPPKIAPSFAQDLEQSARTALAPLIIDGTIAIESVTVETGGSRSRLTVAYHDLLSRSRIEESIPIG